MVNTANYRLFFYKTSSGKEIVTDFTDSFSNKIADKIRSDMRLLEEYGFALLSTSKVKKISGLSNLYELRIKSNVQVRLFFGFASPNTFLIVHGFIKKTNKTPLNEIRIAVKRLKEFDI
ncbi:type II toxin-antitoxin system RelE/ParE family toxin [bacterium]|nr:MAG: type II toxin-antitoxin system RelE/ParE family toxin [bacterium]